MDFEAVKKKLAEAFAATQNLEVKPTRNNVDMLSVIMRDLDDAYAIIENTERDAEATAEKKEE